MDLCITWRIEKELVVFKIELLIDVDATGDVDVSTYLKRD